MRRSRVSRFRTSQLVAPARRSARRPMSKRRCAVSRSTASSSAVRRSIRSVPSPRRTSSPATERLRGLTRLLPLPWAKSTMPVAPSGRTRLPSTVTPPAATRTSFSSFSIAVRLMGSLPSRASRLRGSRARLLRGGVPLGVFPKDVLDLVVLGRFEVLVEDADGADEVGHPGTYDLVRLGAKGLAGLLRADRNRHHQAGGRFLAQGANRRPHRGARRQPVVHDEDDAALDSGRRTAVPESLLAPARLGHLPLRDGLELRFRNADRAEDVGVQEPAPVGRDRPDGQLRLVRRPDLARDDDVEIGVQAVSDLSGDGETPPRDAEDEDVAPRVGEEVFRQLPSRVPPVPVGCCPAIHNYGLTQERYSTSPSSA